MASTPKWVVYFETGGIGKIPSKRRYLRVPGSRRFRGMYRNRRPCGYFHAVWTDDRDRAMRFESPSAAKRLRWAVVPARWEKMQFEKIEEDRDDVQA